MADQQVLKNECIKLWRSGPEPRTITSTGLSMHPLIPEGSMLTFLACAADRSIAVGDIVLFERANSLVAHRIIGRFRQNGSLWFREKGDNNFLPGSFSADTLVGRIIRIEYKGKVRDLNRPWPRLAGYMIGTYWGILFAFLRGAAALKLRVFQNLKMPRVRLWALNTARFLSRLPTRFTR